MRKALKMKVLIDRNFAYLKNNPLLCIDFHDYLAYICTLVPINKWGKPLLRLIHL